MSQTALLDPSPEAAEHFPTIGELVTNSRGVPPDTPVKTVADEFFQDPQLDAVAIIDAPERLAWSRGRSFS